MKCLKKLKKNIEARTKGCFNVPFFRDKIKVILISLIISSIMVNINLAEFSSNSKLNFVFLLHANQANVPYGDVANDLCYNAVLKTMLDHPTLHFPIHFSGTLLTDLMWFNATTVDMIKNGIESEQFEIIGSTFAQNIMYSNVDDYDNRLQIEKHREVIKEIFNVEPRGFWNPERCWNQDRYVKLISEGGYEYTFVEDHILNESSPFTGYDEYKVRNTSVDENSLLIINDDKKIIELIDNVAFTTQNPISPAVISAVDQVINYLYEIYLNDTEDDYLVFYGQDMEVWGLWQEEGRPEDTLENTIARLDYLFSRLEDESDWLNVVTPSEFLDSLPAEYVFEYIPRIADGSANWMHIPSVKEGFKDWFDFSENDSRLKGYREQFAIARNQMKNISELIENSTSAGIKSASKLLDYAEYVYVANQYEFGCIGCYFPWYYRIKTALITAEAAKYALNPHETIEVVIKDLDFDGNNEYILRNNKSMFVFTGLGGRLINWYDIEQGIVLLANDIPNSYATWTVAGLDYPTSYLASPVEEVTGADLWGRTTKSYNIRPKAFYETFQDEESSWIWKSRNRTAITGNNSLQFIFDYSGRIISKVFQIDSENNKLKISYKIINDENKEIEPRIGLSFSPGNTNILSHGSINLFELLAEVNDTHQVLKLWNVDSPVIISLEMPSRSVDELLFIENDPIFALGYQINLEPIAPKETLVIEFELTGLYANGSNDITLTVKPSTTTKPLPSDVTILPALLIILALAVHRKKRR